MAGVGRPQVPSRDSADGRHGVVSESSVRPRDETVAAPERLLEDLVALGS